MPYARSASHPLQYSIGINVRLHIREAIQGFGLHIRNTIRIDRSYILLYIRLRILLYVGIDDIRNGIRGFGPHIRLDVFLRVFQRINLLVWYEAIRKAIQGFGLHIGNAVRIRRHHVFLYVVLVDIRPYILLLHVFFHIRLHILVDV